MQHLQLPPRRGDGFPRQDLGAGDLLALEDQGQGVADHAALPGLQLLQNLGRQKGERLVPVGVVQSDHLEGLRRLEGEAEGDALRIAVGPLVVEGKLHGGELRHPGVVLHGLILLG